MEVFRVAGNNSKRCVILFGWTGGSLRHVAKHSALWSNLGVSSIATTVSLQDTFLPRDDTGLRDKARTLLDTATLELGAEEVVAHCFSNGGCLLFVTLLEELEERRLQNNSDKKAVVVPSIAGTIYDSCPIPSVHPAHGPWLLLFATPFPWKEKMMILGDLLPHAIQSTLLHPFQGNPIAWFGGLRDPAVNSPVDRPELVDKFASLRASQGARVTKHEFPPDSPHVQHYRMRPDEYTKAVAGWLSNEVGWN
eukprot:scaffold23104_cov56-Attheya_sp.AAC.1